MRPSLFAATTLGSVLVALSTLPASAQSALTEHTLQLDEGGTPAPVTLDQVAWLAGVWVGTGLGGRIEEVWMPPLNGSMVGAFKASGEDGVSFYELVTMAEEAGTVVMKVKHFNPDMSGWEEKDEFEAFPVVALEENVIRFSGVTYVLEDPDTLTVYVAMSRRDGMTELVFDLKRVGTTGG